MQVPVRATSTPCESDQPALHEGTYEVVAAVMGSTGWRRITLGGVALVVNGNGEGVFKRLP